MKICLLALSILMSICSTVYSNETCNLPETVHSWDYDATASIAKGKDWKNTNLKTDYWKLSLSWAPQYCDYIEEKNRHSPHQCENNQFGLIIHGLWAQSLKAKDYKEHPRNCHDVEAIDVNVLKKYLCIMPGIKLIQKEWEKHGTCDFQKSEKYLEKTKELFDSLVMPSRDELFEVEYSQWPDIEKLFVDSNKENGVVAENVWIKKEGGRLKEIHVCYDLDFKLRACD